MKHMAVKVTKTHVCDVCGKEDDLTQYTIGKGGRPRKVDLCPTHAKPVQKIYEKARAAKGRSRPGPTPKVTTMDEIAKMKKGG